MSGTLQIDGSIVYQPNDASTSSPTVPDLLTYRGALNRAPKTVQYVLTDDTPVSVSFDGMTGINAVRIEASGKVRARLTSADGTQQAISVDPILILISESVPYTALDLTRVAGAATEVTVLIGAI
jgi:hypothetical protein